MKINSYKLTCLFFIIITMMACKKNEKTNWDIDIATPLAYGKLTLAELIPDSLLELDIVNNQVNLVFSQQIIDLNLDTLLEIPDTSIINTLKPIFTFTFPANTNLLSPLIEDLDFYTNEVELSLIKIKSGKVIISLTSNIQGKLNYNYSVPGATLNGSPLLLNVSLPAAPVGGTSEVTREIDLSGYVFDLTGTSGNNYNKLSSILTVKTDSFPVPVSSILDSVYSVNTFSSIVPEYAKGYLGNISEVYNMQNVDFSLSNSISGMVNFDEVTINFDIKNGFGVDARLNINDLSSINTQTNATVPLISDFIGNALNLNRAIDLGSTFTPSNYNINFNQSNSNIDAFIENWPNQLGYDASIEINPLGNISNYNDFVYNTSKVEASMNINIPLKFSTNGLTVADTVELQNINSNTDSDSDINKINSGKLYIEVKNTFPFSGAIELTLLDVNGNNLQVIDEINIVSGQYNELDFTTSENKNLIVLEATTQLLENLLVTTKLAIKATFNTTNSGTTGIVSISPHSAIVFRISADFNYNVTLK